MSPNTKKELVYAILALIQQRTYIIELISSLGYVINSSYLNNKSYIKLLVSIRAILDFSSL